MVEEKIGQLEKGGDEKKLGLWPRRPIKRYTGRGTATCGTFGGWRTRKKNSEAVKITSKSIYTAKKEEYEDPPEERL